MPFERGQGRYIGTGGYIRHNNPGSGHDGFSGDYREIDKSKRCPLCGKLQDSYRNSCIACGYSFNKRNKDLEVFISKFEKQKWKIPLVKMQKIVKNNYRNTPKVISGLKLISHQYENIFNMDSNNKILFVSDDDELIDIVQKDLISGENKLIVKLGESSINADNLIECLDEFMSVNNSLSKYSVKTFNNINSMKYVSDLKCLSEDVHYIDENDAEILNNFIKDYWKFYKYSQETGFDSKLESYNLEQVVSNQLNELFNLKKYINWFNDNINKLTEIYDSIGIKYGDVSNKINLMNNIHILEKSPCLIDKKIENNFIKDLNNYQKENEFKQSVQNKIHEFINNQNLDVLDNFNKFCEIETEYEKINGSILELKNHLKLSGVNCSNLDEYYDLKNNMSHFSDATYFDGKEYRILNQKISQYISKNTQSFSSLIDYKKEMLISYVSKLIDENSIMLSDTREFNEKMIGIKDIFDDIGVNFDSISEIDNGDSLNLLQDNIIPNFHDNSEFINALEEFDHKHDSNTINEYFINVYNSLNDLINEIFSKVLVRSNENFEMEYLGHNINIIKGLIEKMGIATTSIIELNHSLNLSDTLDSLDESDIREKLMNTNSSNLLTDGNADYLKNNTPEEILNDLNMLNISLKSLIYEINQNEDYAYINDLKNEFNCPITEDFKNINDLKSRISSLTESDDFEEIMNNFQEIFDNCYNLIEKADILEYEYKFNNLEEKFDMLFKIYSQVDDEDILKFIDGTQNYLIGLKENNLFNSKFHELYQKGVFSDKTINSIKNNEIRVKLNDLYELFCSVKEYLIENSLEYFSCDEIILRNENLIGKLQSKNNHFQEILVEFEKMDLHNFYEVYLNIDDNFNFSSEFTYIKSNFKLISDIFNLNSKLDIPHHNDITNYDYDEIKEFHDFLNNCIEFSDLVDSGIINNDSLFKFPKEIEKIDNEIETIKKELSELNLDYDSLNNLSKINSEKLDEIRFRLNEINKIRGFQSDEIVKLLKNQMSIIDIAYSLCIEFPEGSEYKDSNFNVEHYKNELSNLKNTLVKYDDLLKLENKVLSYHEIIENNLSNEWNGLFSDMEQIKSKFKIDDEFTQLYNQGIFTDKTIRNLNSLSVEDVEFIKDFKKQLSDENLKSEYLLIYTNQEYLLDELNKLEKTDESDLSEILVLLKNLNNILKSSKIDESISILEYHIRKDSDGNMNKSYLKELKSSFSLIYYKYFDETEFNISIEAMLNKADIHIKFTELINNKIIEDDNLIVIKSDIDNFMKKVNRLEKLSVEIENNLDSLLTRYHGKQFSELSKETDFKRIKKVLNNMDEPDIYLANHEYVRNNLKKKYSDYFDYVICEDNELSEEDKLHLFLLSKHKLNIFHVVDRYA